MAGTARSEHYLGAGSQLFLFQPFELIEDTTVDTLPSGKPGKLCPTFGRPHRGVESNRRNRTVSTFFGSTGLTPPLEFLYHSINAEEEIFQAISELHLQRRN